MSKFLARPLAIAIQRTIYFGLLGTSLCAATQTVVAQESIAYNIPASSLDRALSLFSAQSAIEFAFDPKQVQHFKSQGLKGNYSIEAGFAALLTPHGLQIQNTSKGYVITQKVKTQVRDMGQLNTIDVNGIAKQNVSSENVAQLPVITVNAMKNGSTEDGYLVKNITGAGIWGERSLQDTPYSMAVIPQELIENVQAKDMQQIFKINPTTQESGKQNFGVDSPTATMRGFSVANPIVNGISYSRGMTTAPMMQDIERVEIISGATGFLYGGGRVGGSVNYLTKKPTTENLKNITIGSYGSESYYTHVDLGGQFDENNTFGYRVNAFYQDGELPNETEKEQKAISIVFDWKPTDNFYTNIKYLHRDSFTKGGGILFRPGLDRASIKKNKSYSPDWMEEEIKSDKIENSVIWNINEIFTLRTNLFFEEMKSRGDDTGLFVQNGKIIGSNGTGSSPSWLSRQPWYKTENNGANIYLDSKFDLGSTSHSLSVGYTLSSYKGFSPADWRVNYDFIHNIDLNDLKNFPEPDSSLWSGTVGTQPLKISSRIQYQNILIGDDIVFNEQWSALVGANYATIINTSYSDGVQGPKYDVSELTPTLSLIYKPFEDLTTYVTYIESLEAGTIVGSRFANATQILEPYKSKQYELGAKYSLLDQKALLTAALFRIEKANQYEVDTRPKPTLTQDGEQIHQGLELGLTGKVTDHLTLFGGVTFMDLSVEKATSPTLEGKKPTNAASKMAKLYAEYQIPTVEGLYLSAGAYYTGEKYGNELNTDIIPSYTLYDAGLRYKTKLGQYPTTLNLTAQNLTDKVYWTNTQQLGDPRTVAFSVKTQF